MNSGRRTGPRRRGGDLTFGRRFALMMAGGAATLVALAVAIAALSAWIYFGPGPEGAAEAQKPVELRTGAHLPEIAETLERAHVVSSGPIFMAMAQVTGSAKRLKAGEYAFPAHVSMAGVMDRLRRGDVLRRMVTIPEGFTSEQVVEVLMNEDALTGAAPIPPEGAVLPETYEIRRGEDRAEVLQRMMDARDALLKTLWAQRRDGIPLQTPEQAVVLASIVEKETGLADERPRVAAVFENRLTRGIRLESDPTVVYGITGGKPLGHGLKASELASATPYNTYQINGLPPSPICNPGRAAIAAVLDPPRSDELYFVADGTGGHAFASTLDAHHRNVERWRAIEHGERANRTGG